MWDSMHRGQQASIAQWQSTGLVNQGSRVQSSLEAVFCVIDFFNIWQHFGYTYIITHNGPMPSAGDRINAKEPETVKKVLGLKKLKICCQLATCSKLGGELRNEAGWFLWEQEDWTMLTVCFRSETTLHDFPGPAGLSNSVPLTSTVQRTWKCFRDWNDLFYSIYSTSWYH